MGLGENEAEEEKKLSDERNNSQSEALGGGKR